MVLIGCSSDDLSGHYWNINVSGIADACTGAPADHTEKLEYRVKIDGQDVELAVGPDVFASGTMNGCDMFYDSVVWAEQRGDAEIRWQIHGSATVNTGGSSCNPANGTDWDGTETFEIISSEDPSFAPGCEYTLALSGKYVEEVR